MASSQERPSSEQETLIYATPEQGQEAREALQEKLRQDGRGEVRRGREVVADELAEQFAQAGQAVTVLRTPWEHTEAEHAEAQALVDTAFAKDLGAALRAARQSPHFPRNLDLFHDVLTSEMYDLVREHKLNRQPLGVWVLFVIAVILVVMLVSAGLLIAI